MGKTVAEKILSAHSGEDAYAGDIVIADIDFCFGQDGTSYMIIDELNKIGAEKVFDSNKVAMVIDHSSPSPLAGVSAIHKKMREYAKKMHIKLYDIGEGVCHQIVPERGEVVPGDLVVGADSHTCTYGAINVCSTGVGSTDLAAAAYTGKLWFRVPETLKFICHGSLPKRVYSKDLILYLIGDVSADGATYMAVEYTGEAISELSQDARFTISNMAVEMGAKFGVMEVDSKTAEWVKVHSKRGFTPVFSDEDAEYKEVREYDVSALEPQVAKPHTVDNVSPISEVEGIRIQQGFIGTCTNGRLEDLRIAASILEGRRVHEDARLIVAPASKQIFLDAIQEGIVETLIKAGAVFVTPGCGCCVGTHNGVPSDGENVISTANRNFFGRMGNNKDVSIYLSSPATVAASMINGEITDPRKYGGGQ